MSEAEQGAWATYAAAIIMQNRLGESMYLTGFNHFLRSNAARLSIGGAIVEAGPTTLTLPGADSTLAIAADNGTQLLTVAFDDTQDWCKETGGFLSVEMGMPQLHTRNYFGGPYRNAGALLGNTAVPITSPQTVVAPFTLVADQKIWTRAAIILADGRLSNKFAAPVSIVGGLLPLYSVTGTLSPDAVCNYPLGGAFNGKAYYKRSDGAYFIWWDGTDTWYISVVLGTPGAGHWLRNDPAIIGVFTAVAPNTGDATVGAGEHP